MTSIALNKPKTTIYLVSSKSGYKKKVKLVIYKNIDYLEDAIIAYANREGWELTCQDK